MAEVLLHAWPDPFIAQFNLKSGSIDFWVQKKCSLTFLYFRHLDLARFWFYVSDLNTWMGWMKVEGWISVEWSVQDFCVPITYFADIFNTRSNFDSSVFTVKLWNFWKLNKHFPPLPPLFSCSQLGTWKTPFLTVLLKMFNCSPGRMPLSTVYSSQSRGVLSYYRYSKHRSTVFFLSYCEFPLTSVCYAWDLD